MRVIPKNTNQKNTLWRWLGLKDVLVGCVILAVAVVFFATNLYVPAVIFAVVAICMLIPTSDGCLWEILFTTCVYLFKRKKYTITLETNKKTSAGKDMKDFFPLKEISEDGLITYEGGKYARVIEIGTKNYALEDEDEQNTDIDFFANALKEVSLNMTADLICVRRPIDISYQCDREREYLENADDEIRRGILEEKLNELETINRREKKYRPYFCLVLYCANRDSLDNSAMNMLGEISASGLACRMLDAYDAAIFLRYCVGPKVNESKIRKTPLKDLASVIPPKEVSFKATSYSQGKLEATQFAINDYPLRVRNAWGCELFNIADTKVVIHIKQIDKPKAIKSIDKCITEMGGKRDSADKMSEAMSAETHIETMENLLESLQNDNEVLFNTSIIVTGYGKNVRKNLRRVLQMQGFKLSALYGQQMQAYKCSLPTPDFPLEKGGHGINSTSLAACFPFVWTYSLDPEGNLLGRSNGAPFILDMWKRNGNYQNSNAMIIGKSGSGKSYFTKSLLCNEWAKHTRIMILDPENEYDKLTRNLGGKVLDVASARDGIINPFHIYKSLSDDGSAADFRTDFDAHLKTLESFYKIVLDGAPMEILERINILTTEAYDRKGINMECMALPEDPDAFPTFDDLMDIVHEKQSVATDDTERKELRYIEMYLNKFCTGRYADIWDGPSTISADADVMDFTFQTLFANKNNTVANAQMLLLFGFLEQEVINSRIRNAYTGNLKTLIVVDEAHLFIDAKYPIALDFFYSMCKRIRKYDGSFYACTQSVADWNANEDLSYKTTAILKNSQYNFIFKLAPPDMKDLQDLYSYGSGFNEEEQARITRAQTGQMFFIGSTADRFCVNVETGEYERMLFQKKENE